MCDLLRRAGSKVVHETEGKAHVILSIGSIVGQRRSYVLRLKHADSESLGKEQIQSTPRINGKRSSAGGYATWCWIDAAEAVHIAKQTLSEDL